MIQLDDISLSYGSREIFKSLSWSIKDNRRIGLFGPNGVGKTTLLNVIAGLTEPDSGTVIFPPNTVVGYLPQELSDTSSERTVVEECLTAFTEIRALEREMEAVREELGRLSGRDPGESDRLLRRLDEIQNELNARGSHTVRYQTEKILLGLGFEIRDLNMPLRTFSGGWRMRVALAKLLLVKPDILLLDEPTNHLDIESIDWLENYLEDFKGAVILVSHDRYFLDRMVDTIAELHLGRIMEYSGNYSSYIVERRARLEIHKSAYENQQRKIRDTERFIERFRYKNTKAKQVQSRIKALEKLERIPPPPCDDSVIHFKFPEPDRSGKTVLGLSRFSKTYRDKDSSEITVFKDAGPLTVLRGDKIALVGKNGAGKSTLTRILIGTEPFDGEREEGYNVSVTFFAQHLADSLDPSNTLVDELESGSGVGHETRIRTLLGAFLFSEDDVYKNIAVLSGGEKSRVALAKTLLSPRNLLVLDEPTNHLDIQSRNVLIEALRQYEGTFIVVSHDRHFLDLVANKIWYAEKGRIVTYPGTYSEFKYHQGLRETQAGGSILGGDGDAAPAKSGKIGVYENKTTEINETRRHEAERRNRLYRELKELGIENMENWEELSLRQLETALQGLEQRINKTEKRISEMEAFLAEPGNFRDKGRSAEASSEFGRLSEELRRLYDRWDRVSAYLENNKPE
ncbi:MAG: ABC-F family ATP-binding cassette domain-containing protein [Thermodesulfobacteriota bacterium]